MSKSAFKRALGTLYKEKVITLKASKLKILKLAFSLVFVGRKTMRSMWITEVIARVTMVEARSSAYDMNL